MKVLGIVAIVFGIAFTCSPPPEGYSYEREVVVLEKDSVVYKDSIVYHSLEKQQVVVQESDQKKQY